jgi:hypothetical protein
VKAAWKPAAFSLYTKRIDIHPLPGKPRVFVRDLPLRLFQVSKLAPFSVWLGDIPALTAV